MRALVVVLSVATMIIAARFSYTQAQDGNPSHNIKQVMKQAHKDGLLKTVAGGSATAEQKQQLLTLYKALAANEAPQGDAESWQGKTAAVVAAAQAIVDGGSDYAALKKATNCGGCHKAHKPK